VPASSIKRALASCRRVFLLLLLALSLFAGWVYWQWPGMNSLRPHIEHYLQQNLQLDSLKLGELSWAWSGFLWIKSDRLQFSGRAQGLSYRDGSVSVRIPLAGLLRGEVLPDRIQLHRGRLDVHVMAGSAPLLPGQLVLEDVQVGWRYRDWLGTLEHVKLLLDGAQRRITVDSPSLVLSGRLAADGLIQQLHLLCKHDDWLPATVQDHVQGSATIEVDIKRQGARQWVAGLKLVAEQPVTLQLHPDFSYSMNQLTSALTITTSDAEVLQPVRVMIEQLDWSLGDNRIAATGSWQHGRLSLKAAAKQLAMPLVWGWLPALGDDEWKQWLASMHAGHASHAFASIALGWDSPLTQWPSDYALEHMQYHVQAEVSDADISLGLNEGALLHTSGQLVLDQQGLKATIDHTLLPENAGSSSGTLSIDWGDLNLVVAGKADVDVANLLAWLNAETIDEWQWHAARAEAHYQLRWAVGDAAPQQASAVLHPQGSWAIDWGEHAFDVEGGTINWSSSTGLQLNRVGVATRHLQGHVSMTATPTETGSWHVQALDSQLTGALQPLLTAFQVPVSDVDGNVDIALSYDGHWSGVLDLQQAAWQRLLGSEKRTGDALAISFSGVVNKLGKLPEIELADLRSNGKVVKLGGGSISVNRARLKAHLLNVVTPSFSGSLHINVPFDNKPWQADVQAKYLNRNALPESLDQAGQLIDRRWKLKARVDRFDWDEATMSGVRLNLSSKPGSVGMFEATQFHTSQLDIMDVVSRFTLPGEGRVELRKFSASVEKQHLLMSAILSPVEGGGMRWSGFAELDGDFGHLIQRGGLSERFLSGDGRILFSGQGYLLREQPWWKGLDGRLRLRVDEGRILEGGTLTTLLSAINLSKLPALLFGQRDDLTGPGIKYERLQMEAIMQNQDIHIRNVVLRSSAFDLVGHGKMDLDQADVDLYLIARPLQNIDALLGHIPLLRDIIGGAAHSFMRNVYHMSGSFTDARVERVAPEQAGLASAGLIEAMLALPNEWFGSSDKAAAP